MSTIADPIPTYQPVKKGLAIASLVLGILAIIGCLIPVLNIGSILLAVVAIVLGILAILQARRPGRGGRGMAVTGVILSVLAIIVAILANVVFGAAVNGASKAIDKQNAKTATVANPEFPGQRGGDVVGQPGAALTVGDVSLAASPLAVTNGAVGSFACTNVTYTNNGKNEAQYNLLDWHVLDSAGATHSSTLIGDGDLSAGDLVAGGNVAGKVCFDQATTGTGKVTVLYDAPSLTTSARGAWLNTL